MVPEIWSVTDRMFIIMEYFLPFYRPMGPRKSNFWQNEKTLEDIIILQMFNINDSHMIYGFSDMLCNRQNFFVIFDHFLPFYPLPPLTTQKIKILKNWKKLLELSSFYQKCTKNHDLMLYCSLDMARDGFNCYFSFWAIF